MPISFHCPHCQTPMLVLEEYAGQTGPCAVCAKTITVPMPRTRPGDPPQAPTSSGLGLGKPQEGRPGLSPAAIFTVLLGTGAASVLLVVLSLLFVRVALPAIQAMRVDGMNRASQANLEKIAQALNQYQSDHGTYPPAYFVDAQGRPTHSWRVLILPQLGYDSLYRSIDLDLPWDAPENLHLAFQMPSEYYSFGDREHAVDTRFVVLTGPETMFPGEQSVSAATVTDDPRAILTVVEVNGPPIEWMRPDGEPTAASFSLVVNNDPHDAANQVISLTGNVATVSGDVYLLPEHTSWQLLSDMTTHSGGEMSWSMLLTLLDDS